MIRKMSALIASRESIIVSNRRPRYASMSASIDRGSGAAFQPEQVGDRSTRCCSLDRYGAILEPEGVRAVDAEESARLPVVNAVRWYVAQAVVHHHRLRDAAHGADSEHVVGADI